MQRVRVLFTLMSDAPLSKKATPTTVTGFIATQMEMEDFEGAHKTAAALALALADEAFDADNQRLAQITAGMKFLERAIRHGKEAAKERKATKGVELDEEAQFEKDLADG